MIRINRQTDYAIRLILSLAQQEKGATGIHSGSSKGNANSRRRWPSALWQTWRAANSSTPFPGRDGGLVLARPAQEINLRQIVEHFEGKFFISDCLVDKGNCPFDNNCPVRFRWTRLQSQIVQNWNKLLLKTWRRMRCQLMICFRSGVSSYQVQEKDRKNLRKEQHAQNKSAFLSFYKQ